MSTLALPLPRLMLIADGFVSGRASQTAEEVQDCVCVLVEAGLTFVMLRDQQANSKDLSEAARDLVNRMRTINPDITLVVNSMPEDAEELSCGLHIGRRAATAFALSQVSPFSKGDEAPRAGGGSGERVGVRGGPLQQPRPTGYSAHAIEDLKRADSVSETATLSNSSPFRHPPPSFLGVPPERGTVESPLQSLSRPVGSSTRAPRGGGVLLQNAIEAIGERGEPVGYSAHSLEDIQRASVAEFDYATFSPIFSTQTHPEATPAGIEALTKVCTSVPNFPVYALGGITPERVRKCLDAGTYGVAVLSDLLDAADPVERLAAYRDAGVL